MSLYLLGIMLLGAVERTLSILVDGMPNPAYVGFTVIEFAITAVIFAYSRTTLSAP